MLNELLCGYEEYLNHRQPIKYYIVEILKEHESISGAELHRHLKELGINCTDKAVYYHLKLLRNGKAEKIENADTIRASDGRSQNVRFVEADEKSIQIVLLKNIKKTLKQAKINVDEEFFNDAEDTSIVKLRVFYRQLNDVVLGKDKHEYSSFKLWVELLSNLETTELHEVLSEFLSKKPVTEADIQKITNDYRISPALLLILHFFKHPR